MTDGVSSNWILGARLASVEGKTPEQIASDKEKLAAMEDEETLNTKSVKEFFEEHPELDRL
ncbi:MAG: hypothetical protein RBS96_02690 [Dehalococcoidales bacterium]|nr:hypothetical protein [Dehalococcoidales bacterium]